VIANLHDTRALAKMSRKDFLDLGGRIEEMARRLLGEPNHAISTRRQWRYGARGSLSIEVCGGRRGSWYDHEEGVGGGPWQLVTVKGGMSPAEAMDWLRREFGAEFVGGDVPGCGGRQ
jgi:hypothetical protein